MKKRHILIILEMETYKDYILLIVKSKPKSALLRSFENWNKRRQLGYGKFKQSIWKKYCWKEYTLWSAEDFTSSIGNFRKEADKNYILNQYWSWRLHPLGWRPMDFTPCPINMNITKAINLALKWWRYLAQVLLKFSFYIIILQMH